MGFGYYLLSGAWDFVLARGLASQGRRTGKAQASTRKSGRTPSEDAADEKIA
jgi:hypothetical protein